MIMVDVQVLQRCERYDFELEEDKTVEEVLKDMIMLICKKEQIMAEQEGKYFLYDIDNERILLSERTFREQQVRDGAELVLL